MEFFYMRDPDEVADWLKKAEQDFQGAVTLFRRRKQPLPDLVCFHCQQSAEKYLKAFLILNEKPFPKTHDLLLLLELTMEHERQLELHRDLFEFLNPYSVQYRYPGEETTVEEASLALGNIKQIRRLFCRIIPSIIFDMI